MRVNQRHLLHILRLYSWVSYRLGRKDITPNSGCKISLQIHRPWSSRSIWLGRSSHDRPCLRLTKLPTWNVDCFRRLFVERRSFFTNASIFTPLWRLWALICIYHCCCIFSHGKVSTIKWYPFSRFKSNFVENFIIIFLRYYWRVSKPAGPRFPNVNIEEDLNYTKTLETFLPDDIENQLGPSDIKDLLKFRDYSYIKKLLIRFQSI